MTDSGVEKIGFTNLTEETQRKYGYDPAKASQFQAEEQAATAQRAVVQQQEAAAAGEAADSAQVSQLLDKSAVLISGDVLSVADGGVLLIHAKIQVAAKHDVVTYTNPLDGSVETTPTAGLDTISSKKPIFVHGVKGLVDGDPCPETIAYPVPSYSYDSARGAAKTVRAFATSKDEAITLIRKASP